MTTKCNQTGCENPAAFRYTWPGEAENSICLEHALKLQEIANAMGCPIQLIPIKEPADQPDLEALKALKLKEHGRGDPLPDIEVFACWEEIRTIPWSKTNIVPIISRYLQKAREDASERLNRECDVLKDTNDKLRDQLCANTKLVSELQHTVRLVQETHSQHVHECAMKAAKTLHHRSIILDGHEAMTAEVIESCFGAPATENECEEMFEREWAKYDPYSHPSPNPTEGFTKAISRKMFQAAWNLAKGEKSPC